jgi:steroid delta-isomerase-like uncharacterized protein
MSIDTNKALLRRVTEEFYNQGNLAVADELFAADYVHHDLAAPDVRDRDGLKQSHAATRVAFPDFLVVVEHLIAEGEWVVTHWTLQGTHLGAWQGLAPTGKRVTASGLVLNRISDGKIHETWWGYDLMGVLQQLGTIPTPPQPTP